MNKTFNPPKSPAGPPGVPVPYPNLVNAAISGTPVIQSVADLLEAMRAGMPYGPFASLPKHYKDALNANGIATPTGPAALKQQTAIAQLEQKVKNWDGVQLANLDLQDMLQKQKQTTQSKTMHEVYMNVISNMKA